MRKSEKQNFHGLSPNPANHSHASWVLIIHPESTYPSCLMTNHDASQILATHYDYLGHMFLKQKYGIRFVTKRPTNFAKSRNLKCRFLFPWDCEIFQVYLGLSRRLRHHPRVSVRCILCCHGFSWNPQTMNTEQLKASSGKILQTPMQSIQNRCLFICQPSVPPGL